MSYKDDLAAFANFEGTAEKWFADHLETYTELTFRSHLGQADDMPDNVNIVAIQITGSNDALAPASQTLTGDEERCIFDVVMEVSIETTQEEIRRNAATTTLNYHQQKVGLVRSALFHGILDQTANCPQLEVIGYMNTGPTQIGISERDNIQTTMSYNFQLGIKSDGWPVPPAP